MPRNRPPKINKVIQDFENNYEQLLQRLAGSPGLSVFRRHLTELRTISERYFALQNKYVALSDRATSYEALQNVFLGFLENYSVKPASLPEFIQNIAWDALGYMQLLLDLNNIYLARHQYEPLENVHQDGVILLQKALIITREKSGLMLAYWQYVHSLIEGYVRRDDFTQAAEALNEITRVVEREVERHAVAFLWQKGIAQKSQFGTHGNKAVDKEIKCSDVLEKIQLYADTLTVVQSLIVSCRDDLRSRAIDNESLFQIPVVWEGAHAAAQDIFKRVNNMSLSEAIDPLNEGLTVLAHDIAVSSVAAWPVAALLVKKSSLDTQRFRAQLVVGKEMLAHQTVWPILYLQNVSFSTAQAEKNLNVFRTAFGNDLKSLQYAKLSAWQVVGILINVFLAKIANNITPNAYGCDLLFTSIVDYIWKLLCQETINFDFKACRQWLQSLEGVLAGSVIQHVVDAACYKRLQADSLLDGERATTIMIDAYLQQPGVHMNTRTFLEACRVFFGNWTIFIAQLRYWHEKRATLLQDKQLTEVIQKAEDVVLLNADEIGAVKKQTRTPSKKPKKKKKAPSEQKVVPSKVDLEPLDKQDHVASQNELLRKDINAVTVDVTKMITDFALNVQKQFDLVPIFSALDKINSLIPAGKKGKKLRVEVRALLSQCYCLQAIPIWQKLNVASLAPYADMQTCIDAIQDFFDTQEVLEQNELDSMTILANKSQNPWKAYLSLKNKQWHLLRKRLFKLLRCRSDALDEVLSAMSKELSHDGDIPKVYKSLALCELLLQFFGQDLILAERHEHVKNIDADGLSLLREQYVKQLKTFAQYKNDVNARVPKVIDIILDGGISSGEAFPSDVAESESESEGEMVQSDVSDAAKGLPDSGDDGGFASDATDSLPHFYGGARTISGKIINALNWYLQGRQAINKLLLKHDLFWVGGSIPTIYSAYCVGRQKRRPFVHDIDLISVEPLEHVQKNIGGEIVGGRIKVLKLYRDRIPIDITFLGGDVRCDIDIRLRKTFAGRDFTMGAFVYKHASYPSVPSIIDMYGGIHDMCNGIVKCIDMPEKIFGCDPLRLFRFVRYMGKNQQYRPDESLAKLFDCNSSLDWTRYYACRIGPARIAAGFSLLLFSGRAQIYWRIMHTHRVLHVYFALLNLTEDTIKFKDCILQALEINRDNLIAILQYHEQQIAESRGKLSNAKQYELFYNFVMVVLSWAYRCYMTNCASNTSQNTYDDIDIAIRVFLGALGFPNLGAEADDWQQRFINDARVMLVDVRNSLQPIATFNL